MNNNTEKAADYYIKMFELYKKNNKQGITEMLKFLESNL